MRESSAWDNKSDWAEDSVGARKNTLGIDLDGVRALATRLDALDGPRPSELKRDFVRWPFHRERIRIQIDQPGGTQLLLKLACRNLSRGGISLFHNAYLHERGRAVVWLPHPIRGEVGIFGTLARCKHRGGMVHELGVRFDRPIDAKEYVSLDAGAEIYSQERVTPERLSGSLLVVDPDAQEQRLIRHFTAGTAIRVRTCTTQTEALAALREPVDLLLVALNLPDGSAAEFVSAVRAVGVRTPVLIITPDVSRESRNAARGAACEGVLGRPLSCDRLLRALAEFMGDASTSASASATTTIASDDPAAEVLPEFIAELHAAAETIRGAIERDNAPECERVCLMIAGAAPALGFAGMVPAVERALQMLAWTKSAKESAVVLSDVVAACERAKAA
ncbi:MAG: response regulator [Phycisphaerae bacterium]|nr:response regulator [Phycisphaerae bacterium]MBN8597503.1 response regulator [Planctomycetota bacterium]